MSKLKRKELFDLLFFLLHCILAVVIANIFDKGFEMLMFVTMYGLISKCFYKQFHADSIIQSPTKAVLICKYISYGVELLYLFLCSSLNISIYSNLLLITLIAFTSALLEAYVERSVVVNSNLTEPKTLTKLCAMANLSEIATKRMYMHYIEKRTVNEIADIEYVEPASIKQSLRRSKRLIEAL
jgi:hypothetical protein